MRGAAGCMQEVRGGVRWWQGSGRSGDGRRGDGRSGDKWRRPEWRRPEWRRLKWRRLKGGLVRMLSVKLWPSATWYCGVVVSSEVRGWT
jgi:hypothetical protein